MASKTETIAIICLYGNSTVGAGWLASAKAGKLLIGDGELKSAM